jgi:micrococcal nuclease
MSAYCNRLSWRGVLTALAVATASAGCGHPSAPPATATGVVTRVIDGDTVTLDVADHQETARLLGIDTPETVHPTKPVMCFGAEAHNRTAALLPVGTTVRLERDEVPRDKYGRLLLYLYRSSDGLFVNQELVDEGYATTLFISPNGAHRHQLEAAVSAARAGGRGLWGACGGPNTPLSEMPKPLASAS